MSENEDRDSGLALLTELNRDEIILTKHYFEHGDLDAALAAAGYQKQAAFIARKMMQNPDSQLCQFYRQLCRDRLASTMISTEKKRVKLWKLAEWAADENDKGKLNDSKLAIQALDMLNRMDGDYAAVEINTKQQMQIQKQTVSYQQRIPKVDQLDNVEELLVEHKDVVKD